MATDKPNYVAESAPPSTNQSTILSTEDALPYLKYIRNRRREHFVVLLLNARHVVIRKRAIVISIGIINASLVHPREVFFPAIRQGAHSIILAHNHPSNIVQSSPEDYAITKVLVRAGKLLGIQILDHIIVSRDCYLSIRHENPTIFGEEDRPF